MGRPVGQSFGSSYAGIVAELPELGIGHFEFADVKRVQFDLVSRAFARLAFARRVAHRERAGRHQNQFAIPVIHGLRSLRGLDQWRREQRGS